MGDITETRVCRQCKKEKLITEFNSSTYNKVLYYNKDCRSCLKVMNRKRYLAKKKGGRGATGKTRTAFRHY